jgi:hypothetical protein
MSGDNAGAGKIFRDDLNRNPRNPWSLFVWSKLSKLKARITMLDSSSAVPRFVEGRRRED